MRPWYHSRARGAMLGGAVQAVQRLWRRRWRLVSAFRACRTHRPPHTQSPLPPARAGHLLAPASTAACTRGGCPAALACAGLSYHLSAIWGGAGCSPARGSPLSALRPAPSARPRTWRGAPSQSAPHRTAQTPPRTPGAPPARAADLGRSRRTAVPLPHKDQYLPLDLENSPVRAPRMIVGGARMLAAAGQNRLPGKAAGSPIGRRRRALALVHGAWVEIRPRPLLYFACSVAGPV